MRVRAWRCATCTRFASTTSARSQAWHDTFEANWDAAVELVGLEVARVWRLYLVGGAMAFRDGRMGVDQILAVRPDGGRAVELEPVRPGTWS